MEDIFVQLENIVSVAELVDLYEAIDRAPVRVSVRQGYTSFPSSAGISPKALDPLCENKKAHEADSSKLSAL